MVALARTFGRLFRLSLWLLGLTLLGVTAWTFLWPQPDVRSLPPADAIVCLGAGMEADGTLDGATATRVARCVQLYEAGIAPRVVFSGGRPLPDGPAAGDQMAALAQSYGLPSQAALSENEAHSTLENALFSLPLIPDATHIILVTEAFHLPRSFASFRWAAWQLGQPAPRQTLVMSEAVRRTASGGPEWAVLLREALAIWFNALRALAYSGAVLLGHDDTDGWLH